MSLVLHNNIFIFASSSQKLCLSDFTRGLDIQLVTCPTCERGVTSGCPRPGLTPSYLLSCITGGLVQFFLHYSGLIQAATISTIMWQPSLRMSLVRVFKSFFCIAIFINCYRYPCHILNIIYCASFTYFSFFYISPENLHLIKHVP